MADNPFTTAQTPLPSGSAPSHAPIVNKALVAQADPVVMSGASWFWWIGGLSVVNTIMLHSGSDTGFIIGLGFTMVIDAMFREYQLVAFIVDALAIGTILALGFFARKGHFWAFVTGIVLYTLDAGIYLLVQDWMAVAFHGLALFYLVRGARKLRAALKAATEPPSVIAPPPVAGA
ncbi:MAG TPA: hypothetical protein PLG56_02540 [Lacunisphaera sp.]|nr:hypothetical protein [Lacunisphaera sp.]